MNNLKSRNGIYQDLFGSCKINEDKGFFIFSEEDNYLGCYKILDEWIKNNKEKLNNKAILIYEVGIKPNKPVPLPVWIIEVSIVEANKNHNYFFGYKYYNCF